MNPTSSAGVYQGLRSGPSWNQGPFFPQTTICHWSFDISHFPLKKRSLVLEGSKLGLLLRGNHKDDKTKGQRPLLKMENEKWKMINDK